LKLGLAGLRFISVKVSSLFPGCLRQADKQECT
jgi:hypothetical protein